MTLEGEFRPLPGLRFYAERGEVGLRISLGWVGTEDGEDELLSGVEYGCRNVTATDTYPLALSNGGFLAVIIRVWLAKTLDSLKRGDQFRWQVIGWAKRFA